MRRTNSTTLYLFGFLLLLFVGCQKDPDELIVPPLELSLKASPEIINFGQTSTINIDVKNADSTFSDIPEAVLAKGSFVKSVNVAPVVTTIYHVRAYQKGKVSIVSVTIVVIPPSAPSIVANFNPSSIEKGKKTVFSWNVTGLVDSVKSNLPGVSGLSGNIEITPTESLTATITAYGKGGVTTQKVTLTVTEPLPSTDEELLCNFGPWKKIKMEFQHDYDGSWAEQEIWQCMQDDLMFFYLTPTKKEVYYNGEIRCGTENKSQEGPWSLNGVIINTGIDYKIVTLNLNILVWIYESTWFSPDGWKKMWVKETFVHP